MTKGPHAISKKQLNFVIMKKDLFVSGISRGQSENLTVVKITQENTLLRSYFYLHITGLLD